MLGISIKLIVVKYAHFTQVSTIVAVSGSYREYD